MNNTPSRARVNDDVLFQELEQEGVLLNLKSGIYFGLDRIGTRIWRLLEADTPVSDVVAAVVADFDVTEEQCAEDVRDLLAALEAQGLVTLT